MKNVKIVKDKLLPILLAGGISLSLSGCGGNVDMSSKSFHGLLEMDEVRNTTQIDEQTLYGNLSDDDLTSINMADTLERYIYYLEQTKDIDFTGVEQLRLLDEDEYIETKTISDDDLKILIGYAKNEGETLVDQENHLIALKKLKYLHDYCDNWVRLNGKRVSVNMMINSVKAAVADELDLSIDDYANMIIPANYNQDHEFNNKYYIKVGTDVYYISSDAREICNTIDYIYEMQTADISPENELNSYKKALNYAKTTIAAGANLANGEITSEHNADYIEKVFIK